MCDLPIKIGAECAGNLSGNEKSTLEQTLDLSILPSELFLIFICSPTEIMRICSVLVEIIFSIPPWALTYPRSVGEKTRYLFV